MVQGESDGAEQIVSGSGQQLDHLRRDDGFGIDDAIDAGEGAFLRAADSDDQAGEPAPREGDERSVPRLGMLLEFLGHLVVEERVGRNRKRDADDLRLASPPRPIEQRRLHAPIVCGVAATESRDRRSAMNPGRVHVRDGPAGRELIVDGTFASFYRPGSAVTGSVWDAIAAPLLALAPKRRREVLILGLGGGSAARIVRAIAPGAHIVGVEFDSAVVEAAREHLDLDDLDVEVVVADAREFLEHGSTRYDAVFEDIFVGEGDDVHKPGWLPLPGLALAAGMLAPGGVLVSNALDEAQAVGKAMRSLFPTVLQIDVEDYDNRIFAGGKSLPGASGLRAAVHASPVLCPSLERLSLRTVKLASGAS